MALAINAMSETTKLNIELIKKKSNLDPTFTKLRRAINTGKFDEVKEFSSVAPNLNLSQKLIFFLRVMGVL